jgi:hypothetical protein
VGQVDVLSQNLYGEVEEHRTHFWQGRRSRGLNLRPSSTKQEGAFAVCDYQLMP